MRLDIYETHEQTFFDGTKRLSFYSSKNKLNRFDGPAVQEFFSNGNLKQEQYWIDHKLHRIDGPAVQEFNSDGILILEEYWIDHKLHRIGGPAYKIFDENGKLTREEYWIDGSILETKEYFLKKTSKDSCTNKIVELDGLKYKLVPVEPQ